MATKRTAKRTRYTDEFRATAVASAIAAGYPSVKGALSHAAADMGIAHQLLRNWVTSQQNPPPQDMLQAKKKELRDLFLDEIYEAAGLFGSKRKDASYSQLVVASATLYDKIRLIDNLPTEIIGVTIQFAELAKRKGVNPGNVIQNAIDEMLAMPDADMLTTGSGVN